MLLELTADGIEVVSPSQDSQDMLEEETQEAGKWSYNAVLLLIETYRANLHKFSLGTKRKYEIWKDISKALQEKGFNVDGNTCDNKMRSLKRRYKTIRDDNKLNGRRDNQWKYYHLMDEVLSHCSEIDPLALHFCGELGEAPVQPQSSPSSALLGTAGPEQDQTLSATKRKKKDVVQETTGSHVNMFKPVLSSVPLQIQQPNPSPNAPSASNSVCNSPVTHTSSASSEDSITEKPELSLAFFAHKKRKKRLTHGTQQSEAKKKHLEMLETIASSGEGGTGNLEKAVEWLTHKYEESQAERRTLEQKMSDLQIAVLDGKEKHYKEVREITQKHHQELKELQEKYQEESKELQQNHQQELKEQRLNHQEELKELHQQLKDQQKHVQEMQQQFLQLVMNKS